MDKERLQKYREVGLSVAYHRKMKGMTQAELAKAIGISRTYLSNIEAYKGKLLPVSLNRLYDIAEVLEIDIKDLI